MKLSLSMIVKNEAKNLPRCLRSVRGLVDEIVIVDTGSTDETVEIAESFGAKVSHFKWCDDFSAARNASLDLCTGDWVLVLDADEAIDAMDHDAICNVIEDAEYPAYNFILRNYFTSSSFTTFDRAAIRNETEYTQGKGLPYYSDANVIRLFRRSPEIRWEGKVHELFCRHLTARGIQIGHVNAVIHHYGKMDGVREASKLKYYYELAEFDHATSPKDTQALFNLAIQAYGAGMYERCLYACENYMKLEKRVKTVLLLLAGMCHQQLERHEQALSCFGMILHGKPDHTMALVQSAISKGSLGDSDAMEGLLEAAVKSSPECINTYLILAKVHDYLGNKDKALGVIEDGLNANPNDRELLSAINRYKSNSIIRFAV